MILVDNSYIGKNKTDRCGKDVTHNAKEIIKV